MHRKGLLDILSRYASHHASEADLVGRWESFIASNDQCFERECLPGHITASGWVVSPTVDRVLLVHHRILDMWLQPGGHAEGESDVLAGALREVEEETGLASARAVTVDGHAWLLDIDIHQIPLQDEMPAHDHYDARFLVVADPNEAITVSEESHDVQWFDLSVIEDGEFEQSLRRMARKSTAMSAAVAATSVPWV